MLTNTDITITINEIIDTISRVAYNVRPKNMRLNEQLYCLFASVCTPVHILGNMCTGEHKLLTLPYLCK